MIASFCFQCPVYRIPITATSSINKWICFPVWPLPCALQFPRHAEVFPQQNLLFISPTESRVYQHSNPEVPKLTVVLAPLQSTAPSPSSPGHHHNLAWFKMAVPERASKKRLLGTSCDAPMSSPWCPWVPWGSLETTVPDTFLTHKQNMYEVSMTSQQYG